MKYSDYVVAGIDKADGSPKRLSAIIGVHANSICNAKAHDRVLPPTASAKLARFLEIDPLKILAAREVVIAKNDEDRRFWRSVASFLFSLTAITGLVAAPSESQAALASMTSSSRINVDYVNSWTRCATICPNPPSVSMLIEACDSPTSFFGQGS